MKNVADFASGYISGLVLAIFVVVLSYLVMGYGGNQGDLGVFLFMILGFVIGSVISIICFFVIIAKMNKWQRVGLFTFIVTVPLVIYMTR